MAFVAEHFHIGGGIFFWRLSRAPLAIKGAQPGPRPPISANQLISNCGRFIGIISNHLEKVVNLTTAAEMGGPRRRWVGGGMYTKMFE